MFKKPDDLPESQKQYYDALENLEKKFSTAKKELERKFQEAKKALENKFAEAFGGAVPKNSSSNAGSDAKNNEVKKDDSKTDLEMNVVEEKPKPKRTSCSTCGKIVRDLNIHNSLVHPQQVLTTQRSRNVATYNFSKKHRRDHGTSNNVPLEVEFSFISRSSAMADPQDDGYSKKVFCKFCKCDLVGANPTALRIHENSKKHKDNASATESSNHANSSLEIEFSFISASQDDPQKLFCKICKCDLFSKQTSCLRNHEDSKKHQKNISLLNSSNGPTSNSKPVVPIEKLEKISCSFCNRVFITLKNRVYHEKMKHKDVKWYHAKYR